jgi:hypothetical protein
MPLPGNPPKINIKTLQELDLSNPVKVAEFKKIALELGLSEDFSLGVLKELEKRSGAPSPAEQVMMQHQNPNAQQVSTLQQRAASPQFTPAQRSQSQSAAQGLESSFQNRMGNNPVYQQAQMQALREQIAKANPNMPGPLAQPQRQATQPQATQPQAGSARFVAPPIYDHQRPSLRTQAPPGFGGQKNPNFVPASQAFGWSGGLSKRSEENYLQYLNQELKKMSALSENGYSSEYIDNITKSAEEFNKAAQEEAIIVWEGMKDAFRKQGANEDFISGIEKEAGSVFDVGRMILSPKMWKHVGKTVPTAAKTLWQGSNATKDYVARASKDRTLGGIMTKGKGKAPGSILTDKTMPTNLSGARTLNMAETLRRDLGANAGREVQDMLDQIASSAKGRAGQELNRIGTNTIQSHIASLEQQARLGGAAGAKASQKLKAISKNDWSGIGKDLNLDPNVVKGMSSPSWAAGKGIHIPEAGRLAKTRDWAKDYTKNPGSAVPFSNIMSSEGAAGDQINTDWFRWTPAKGVSGAGTGAMIGGTAGILGGPVGSLAGAGIGAGIGGLAGTLGPGGALVAGGIPLAAGGLWAGKKMLGSSNAKDQYGLPEDRHRALPFMSNQASGGVGGALLASLIAREMGMDSGLMGIAAPILGGIAGHKYLPEMMNKWKDPYGVGANQIHPLQAYYNRQ